MRSVKKKREKEKEIEMRLHYANKMKIKPGAI